MAVISGAKAAMTAFANTSPRPQLGLRFALSPAPATLIAHRHRSVAELDALERAA